MLRITSISSHISWENKQENFGRIESLLSQINSLGDLVVLPECFATGFTMNTSLCETIQQSMSEGGSLHFLMQIACRYNVVVLASIPFVEDNKYYNRAFFVFPNKSYRFYNKRHLFSIAEESKQFSSGTEPLIVNYKGFNICINVCYDIRFPLWSRNTDLQYDILINIANFPKTRISVIEPLVKARAIENQSYVVFCNRDGKDETLNYIPSSISSDYKGNFNYKEEYYLDYKGDKTQIIYCECNKFELEEFRSKFPVWKDFDNFKIL